MSTSIHAHSKQFDWVPYLTAIPSGAAALIVAFRDIIVKSQQQLGNPVPPLNYKEWVVNGGKAALPFGTVICLQMFGKKWVAEHIFNETEETKEKQFSTLLISSTVAAAISSPFVAMVNGQSMGWSYKKSWSRFDRWVAGAITVQEACCVAGICAGKQAAAPMKEHFGENKVVETAASFITGGIGGFAGHFANTAITRWQNDLKVETHQLMWGVARRTRAVAVSSAVYNFLDN